jgi:hypothetical protein
VTTPDERAILRRLDADGPAAIAAVVEAIEPYPLRGGSGDDDLWRTAVRRWGRRGRELFTADACLVDRGLVGGPAERRGITQAGRDELARPGADEGGRS